MPTYEYVCTTCEHEFDEWWRSAGRSLKPPCPECGSKAVERKLSVFAAREGMTKPAAAPSGSPCDQCCNPDGSCSPT